MADPSIMYNKEFYQLRHLDPEIKAIQDGYIKYADLKMPQLESLQLQGHQLFIRNLFNPKTNYKRLLLYHGTGTGKTMVINALAKSYIDFFKNMKQQPQITIIGFTEKIIIKDLLKFPELGYIKDTELEELTRLSTATTEKDILRRRALKTSLTKRIINRSKGGYYKFYGYQAFSQDLIHITTKGLENKITYNFIYEDESLLQQRVHDLVQKEFIIVNTQLIKSLKFGLIACDECHLLYNVTGKNNRGMAIKYVLDTLEQEDSNSAPRVIFASATPITGSPMEIIDLMDLLLPNSMFKREDFFDVKSGSFKHGTLTKIAELCNGYVSFLKDTDTKVYPKRILKGESIKDIPYLKFTECQMSAYQDRTLREFKKHDPEFETLLSSESITLYDMAYPNPDSNTVGLYSTQNIIKSISNASDAWKKEHGVSINEQNILTGSVLNISNIGKYSSKYKVLLEEIFSLLTQKLSGKIFIYHYYVSGSGLLLIQNILLENGFIDATSTPLSTTKCAICGVLMKDHTKIDDHIFKPARFLSVYGEMSPADIERTINIYDASSNRDGYEYRVLLGSRVINEGYDFKAIRYMFIMSLPKDISTMLQVFGRAVRRNSHITLPVSDRFVEIQLFVSTFHNTAELSPELLNYKRKLNVFLQIQEVEKQLRTYAIDNFINYHKLDTKEASLEGLPYTPVVKFDSSKVKIPDYLDTYYRYGYANEEINAIIIIIKKLFSHQPVWTYDDLIKEIHNPNIIYNTQYDHKSFGDSSIKIAMYFLTQRSNIKLNQMVDMTYNTNIPYIVIGGETRIIVYRDPFYILTPVDDLGIPVLDYDQWMTANIIEVNTNINMKDYLQKSSKEEIIETVNNLINKYADNLYLSLIEVPLDYHIYILKGILDKSTSKVCQTMIPIYKTMNILLYYTDFINSEVAKTYGILNTKDPVGYRIEKLVYMKDGTEVSAGLFNIIERKENQKLIGFMRGKNFLIRLPVDQLEIHRDRRKINRGAICSTYSASQRKQFADLLSVKEKKYSDLCYEIMVNLLAREVKDRNNQTGFKWFYLPFDIMPYL